MRYCPFCGGEIETDSLYCLNCGKKLPDRAAPPKATPTWEPSPSPQPTLAPPARPVAYRPLFQPRPYHPSMKASIGDRCVALFVDNIIANILTCACYIPGIIYGIIKDGIRDGQSVGKGMMNLRVVDFRTGMPATIGQSFIRNCLCGCLDSCTCYLAAFIDEDGRRIGDQIAGTVVIMDR
ncbi:MAG: RDD family protein [Candidatus Heimdallarchaeota archaeon]|nr:MAG: RDD family protein [Candidatus Heimdallarchaeota archaeon]